MDVGGGQIAFTRVLRSQMTELSNNDWPPEIEIEEEQPDRVRYRFPIRDLGRLGTHAWRVLIALVAVLFLIAASQVPIGRPRQAWSPFGFGFALFVLLALSYPIYHLLLYLISHCEIEIRDGELFATERAGWLRRSRRWPLTRLKRLQVMGLAADSFDSTPLRREAEALVAQHQSRRARRRLGTDEFGSGEPDGNGNKSRLVKNLNALTGLLDDGKRFILVAGYPRDWLTRLADDISVRTNAVVEAPNGGKLETAPPILGLQSVMSQAKEDARLAAELEVREQPAESDIQVDAFDGGLSLRVPPAGLRKGSAGLFSFGILWLIFIGGFTALILAFGGGQGGFGGNVLAGLLFISLFWIIGIVVLLIGWNMGRREAALAVVDGKLAVVQTGLRRAKRHEWPLAEVETVRVAPSGMEVNDVPVPELAIQGHKGKLFGMLAGRDPRELAWMAGVLRQAIRQAGADTSASAPVESSDAADGR
jgi:hypothetical protein